MLHFIQKCIDRISFKDTASGGSTFAASDTAMNGLIADMDDLRLNSLIRQGPRHFRERPVCTALLMRASV